MRTPPRARAARRALYRIITMPRLLLPAALLACACAGDVPTGLLVNFQRSPSLGVTQAPHFSWIVPPCEGSADEPQTAYRITVSAAVGGGVVWDSGQVASSDSTYAAYAGPPLAPSTAYTWQVATATASCQSSPSAPAAFVTSLFSGWNAGAMFLTYPGSTFGYFRKEVSVPAGVVSAVAHVTAAVDEPLLSGYKLFINGALADLGPGRGEAPVWEGDGGFRGMPYATLDLTSALSPPGPAVLALQCMHSAPQCIFQVTLYLAGGGSLTMATDGSWLAFNGDLHRKPGKPQHGGSAGTGFLEYIDARGEPVGWKAPGFTPDSQWTPAVASPPTPAQVAEFVPHMKPPFQVHDLVLQTIYPGPPPAHWPSHVRQGG